MTIAPHTGGQGARFFREVCRAMPFIMRHYHMDEFMTISQLRRAVANKFRDNSHIKDPKAVALLIFKGRQELEEVIKTFKNRHHLITEYVSRAEEKVHAAGESSKFGAMDARSPFLKAFLQSNNTEKAAGW
ncbi:unnamed protein product [Pedinophyceae sp. YPF-701]|nr:unnamed protein product [Pedinophyceae sp. YPF-701]